MSALGKSYRRLVQLGQRAASHARIAHLEACYQGVRIDRSSFISPNCHIVATDGSEILIEGSHIAHGVVLRTNHGGRIHIKDSYIGFNCVIAAGSEVTIAAGCQIGEMAVIRDLDHVFGGGQALTEAGHQSTPVHIGRNVWIGSKATVLRGVNVGDDAVIAGSAVVRSDVEARSLVAGVPAKLIRKL